MKLAQLSLFLENRPGHLLNACRIIAQAGLNVETMALADTEQFGILRFLVKDWEKARDVLQQNGLVVKVTDVLAVCVPDQPGGLARLLDALSESDVNIEYMYGFNSHQAEQAVIVLRVNNPDLALKLFQEKNVRVLTKDEVFHSFSAEKKQEAKK